MEKVTNMVGTFLNEGLDGSLFKRAIAYTYQQVILESVQVLTTKKELEKVTNMEGTFLNEDRVGFRTIRVTTKMDCQFR